MDTRHEKVKTNTYFWKILYNLIIVILIGSILYLFYNNNQKENVNKEQVTEITSVDIPLLATYVSKYMEEQLLKNIAGEWVDYQTKVKLEIRTQIPSRCLFINSKHYSIVSFDNIQGMFGVIKATIRDHSEPPISYKIQINKRLDVVGMIDVIFDTELNVCSDSNDKQRIKKVLSSDNFYLCTRTFYKKS